jgi:hypothetical protein
MTIIEAMLLIVGAALLLAAIVVIVCCITWAGFWKSWRKDNDADWE